MFRSATINGYFLPLSGKGLWSTLYGYFAIEPDCETAKVITFYKHGENHGRGGEVEKDWFESNFKGKEVRDENNMLVEREAV